MSVLTPAPTPPLQAVNVPGSGTTSVNAPPSGAKPSSSGRFRTAAVVVGAWTLFSLFFSTREYATHVYSGKPLDWLRIISWLLTGFIWAGLTPVIRYLAIRFPIRRETWKYATVVHIVASVVLSLFELLVTVIGQGVVIYRGKITSVSQFLVEYKRYVALDIQVQMWVYWMVLAIVLAFEHYRMYLQREKQALGLLLRTARLEGEVARAQLDALRTQLHPHFLFNTLNSVMVLLRKGCHDQADEMLAGLAQLLRASLDTDGRPEIPLREEMRLVERYLDIQQVRFGPRLKVEYSIPEELLSVPVPSFLLQPIVENAVRHGIGESVEGGTIRICARSKADILTLEVHDDGVATRPSDNGRGVGLANVRARLHHAYGDKSSFVLDRLPGGSTCARITIPCQFPQGPIIES